MKRLLLCSLTAFAVGCSAADLDSIDHRGPATSAPADSVDPNSKDLGPGARGEEVRAVYEYLARYGYFPNEAVASAFPGFRPLIDHTPADTSVFGDDLASAVRLYQRNMGVTVTGVVDEKTRAVMNTPRCSYPDGYTAAQHDAHVAHQVDPDSPPTAEFDVGVGSRKGFNWFVNEFPPGYTRATFSTYFQNNVLAPWQTVFDWPLTKVSATAGVGTVDILFEWLDGPSHDANGDGKCDPGTPCDYLAVTGGTDFIKFDEEPWSFTGTPTTAQFDFQTAAIHEAGHAIGLTHSWVLSAIMYPGVAFGQVKRALAADDRIAIRSSYAKWTTPGAYANAVDVAVGPQDVWVAFSTNKVCSVIFNQCFATSFTPIAVAGDSQLRPWAVSSTGSIFFRNPTTATWSQVAGCARDIGLNATGNVVVRGCDDRVYLGVMTSNGTTSWLETHRNDGFTRLAAGATGSDPFFKAVSAGANQNQFAGIKAFAVDLNGAPWAWSSENGWYPIDILFANKVALADIAASSDGAAVWAVPADGTPVLALNLQAELRNSKGEVAAFAQTQWVKTVTGRGLASTGLRRVGVDNFGKPYVLGASGQVYVTTK